MGAGGIRKANAWSRRHHRSAPAEVAMRGRVAHYTEGRHRAVSDTLDLQPCSAAPHSWSCLHRCTESYAICQSLGGPPSAYVWCRHKPVRPSRPAIQVTMCRIILLQCLTCLCTEGSERLTESPLPCCSQAACLHSLIDDRLESFLTILIMM